jgi:hypothetical protein
MWELRKALAGIIVNADAKNILPDATDQHYQLHGVTCDWHDLEAAITKAEAHQPGTPEHSAAAQTIASLIRAPALLTPPTARHAQTMFAWTDHTQGVIHDTTRRLSVILANHANHLTDHGQPRQALDILAAARAATPTYTCEIADGHVAALLALGDPAQARGECLAYEHQFDPQIIETETTNPPPSSPRARLNKHLQAQPPD